MFQNLSVVRKSHSSLQSEPCLNSVRAGAPSTPVQARSVWDTSEWLEVRRAHGLLIKPFLLSLSCLPSFLYPHSRLCVCVTNHFSRVWFCVTPWTVAGQAPRSENPQARILEWVAVPSSRRSSQPRDWTQVSYISCIDRRVLYHERHLGSPHSSLDLCKASLWAKAWSVRKGAEGERGCVRWPEPSLPWVPPGGHRPVLLPRLLGTQ